MTTTYPPAFRGERERAWLLALSRAGQPEPRLHVQAGCPIPFVARDGGRTVVFDGVLHDGPQVDRGPPAASRNPAELVMRAYLRWGPAVIGKLRGTYALAIWDGAGGRLLCARDPVGVYPLFYADTGKELLLSTSTESLLGHGSIPGSVSRPALADHLSRGYPLDLDQTYFAAIKRVPPGHALQVDGDARQVYRYWDPAPPRVPTQWTREEELDRFEDLLRRAVGRCLELGPAGIYLSGGIDSATVAVLAADGAGEGALQAPLALSLLFPHPACNEEAVQRLVASRLGVPQVFASFDQAVGAEGLLAAALRLSSEWPAPLSNLFEPGFQYLGAEARRRGCAVILTGGGGDEWLTLSPYYARDLVRRLDAPGVFRLWDARRRSLPLPPLAVLRSTVWRSGLRPLLREVAARRVPGALGAYRGRRTTEGIPDWLAPAPAIRREMYDRVEAATPRRPPGDHYLVEKRRTLDHPLEARAMEDSFAAGRRLGLRMLQPLWDADVVDLLYRTPPELLNRGGREKGLVRDLLASRFPELGHEWVKTVFMDGFLSSVVMREGPEAWRRLGGARALAELGIVDPKRLDVFVRQCFSDGGHSAATGTLWNLLSLEAWLRPRL